MWQINTYTVTYNYTENGGSSATKTSASVNYDSTIDLTPTATKSGYNFVGWNTNKNGTSKLSSLTMDAGNVTLYAIYSKTITATCYYYSGSSQTSKTVSNTIYNNTTSATFELGTTSLSGYTFRGWSTSNSGNATISVASNGSVSLSSNATYYACYKYTVKGTYKYYNGTDYTSSTANATAYMNSSGTKIGGTPTTPTVSNPSGWTARGWSTSSSASGTVAVPSTIISNTNYYYSWSKKITVSYNSNSGTGAPSSQSTTAYLNYAGTSSVSTAITISSTTPTKPGYAFEGWGTSTSSTTASYNSGSKYSKASSITLYAIWTPKNYEVTYTENSKTIVKLTNSLQQAISYANTSTIKVYLSTTESKQITIPSGKRITLDMNEKTLTGAIKNNGTLTTKNSGQLRSTSIAETSYSYIIENSGTLTLNNLNIKSSISQNRSGAIYNTGTITVNGSTVTKLTDGWTVNNIGTFNLNNSTVALTLSNASGSGTALYNTSGTLKINNGKINSYAYGLVVDGGKAYVNTINVTIQGVRDAVLIRNTGAADIKSPTISASNIAVENATSNMMNCVIWSRASNYGIKSGGIHGKVLATSNVDTGKSVETVTTYNIDSTNVVFPTWTANNGQDDIELIRVTKSGNAHTATVYKSKHKNETGKYNVDIYTADANGIWNSSTYIGGINLFF